MNKKYVLGVMAVCALALSACSTGKTQDSGEGAGNSSSNKSEFNVVVQQEMPTADLSQATDQVSFNALNNVYEGIYRLDKDSKPQPAGAAEKAEVSKDGKTYTVKLRKDAKWSNGDAVTASDYVYGWQRTVDPKTASEYSYLFEPVENAAEIIKGDKKVDQLGIKAVNDHELEIKLSKPVAYFDYLLAFPSFFPQHEKTVKENGEKYAATSENAVYNGPFKLADFDGAGSDTDWTYEKNNDYWDKKNVKLKKINVTVVKESSTALNLFQDGQADDVILTGELAQQMANDKSFVETPLASTNYMELNQRKADSPYRNANLRKAISYAIDRDALVKSILGDGSIASTGLVPQTLASNPKNDKDFAKEAGSAVEYNPKKAKAYWEKAKKELGVDKLNAELIASDTDSTKKVIEYIQNTVEKDLPGFKITLSPVPLQNRLDRSNKGDFDLVVGGWIADYADPSSFLDLFVKGNSYNRGQYDSSDYNQAIKDASTTNANHPAKRWTNLLDAEKTIMKDQGVIPLYQTTEGHMRASKVKGVVSHTAGAQFDYKWTYIK